MTLKLQAVSGVKWTAVSMILNTVLKLLQAAVLARFLAPEDFGLMGMTIVVIGFSQIFSDMGLSAAIIHHQDIKKEHLSSFYWFNILLGIVIYLFLCICSYPAAIIYNELRLIRLIPVASLSILIMQAGMQFQILLQKDLKFNTLAAIEIAASAAGAITAVICSVLGQGVWSLVWGQIIDTALRTLVLAIIGWSRYAPEFHFRVNDLKGYISFGLYQMGERSVNYFAERIDQILIGTLLGTEPLGYYNFAFNFVIQPVMKINPVLTKVAFPVFSRVQKDLQRLRKGYIKLVNTVMLINSPILAGIASLAPTAVPLIFGQQWRPSIILIQTLSFVALMRSAGNPIGSLQLALGRVDIGFKWNVFLFIVSVPAIYLGCIIGREFGVVLSLAILKLMLFVPAYVFLVKHLIGKCAADYFKAVIKPFIMSLIMGACIYWMNALAIKSLLFIPVQILAGMLAYILLFWRFDHARWVEAREMLSAILGGTRK